jgi:acyl transferase domain-containing protein
MTRTVGDALSKPGAEPVAIIGIGCRFAGARGPAALWDLLTRSVDAITEIPPSRFDVNAVYSPSPGVPGKLGTRWGGFLEDIDRFDPFFFGIAPREANGMDPQHRIFLEVAWEALEDAGQVPDALLGRSVGVFAGLCTNDYEVMIETPDIDIYSTAGNARSVLSGRVSYTLGLEGPSVVVDTACSSSLVAVHLACQSLWTGESTLALAGGVNLILLPEPSIGFSQAQMLARDGRCKAFDARADGFVRSEGAAVVVLKLLSRARADADPIYAVIRGTAVNNDGRSGGLLMTPSQAGQEAVLRQAYRNAGVAPHRVQYVEAHGTGTSVGDPVEVRALGAVLGKDRPPDRPCLIGSVKTNIGHTEAAAGVAGLIKVALCLKHRALPGSLHVQEPNPHIPWADLPLLVQRSSAPWPDHAGPALAGVSSFGISGTNAHVVLAEVPEEPAAAPAGAGPHLLVLSAHRPEALTEMARAFSVRLGETTEASGLHDICYTAGARRTHHDHRLAVAAGSRDEMIETLHAHLRGERRPGLASGRRVAGHRRRVAFVFPGQGSQWPGMTRELFAHEPVFRQTIEQCDAAMRAHVPWSLVQELASDDREDRFDDLDVIQPMLFALQVALAAQWRSWSIEPDVVIGHSMGEMAAAHVAGILDLEDAVALVCRRSRILQARAAGKGGMAVVELPVDAVRRLLDGFGDRLAVAACNGPTTTVVAGELGALHELRETARRQEIFCQMVRIEYAPHSPQTELFLGEVLADLGGLRPRPAAVPMRSTVTAAPLRGPECGADYWVRNLRDPVLFADALKGLLDDGCDTFVEISGHPLLAAAITQCVRHQGMDGVVVPSLRRDEPALTVMRQSLGALYCAGYELNWKRLYPSGGRVIPLPSYPWQRDRYWKPRSEHGNMRADRGAASALTAEGRGLLGPHLQAAGHSGTHFWQMDIGPRSFPYLGDHRIQDVVVLPAAAYVEMALASAGRALGSEAAALERVAFRKALFLPEQGARTVQLAVAPVAPGEATFEVYASAEPSTWTFHAGGTIRQAPSGSCPEPETAATIQARCAETMAADEFYELAGRSGLAYGPSFQAVERVWRRDGEALGRLRLPAALEPDARAYRIHPSMLDACFQLISAAVPTGARAEQAEPFLPVGIDRVIIHRQPGTSAWGHAVLRSIADPSPDLLEGDLRLVGDDGAVALEIHGFRAQSLGSARRHNDEPAEDDALYEVQWAPSPRPERATAPAISPGTWLLFTDRYGVGQVIADRLTASGERCVRVSWAGADAALDVVDRHIDPGRFNDLRRLVEDVMAPGSPCRGIVHLWSLDARSADTLDEASLAEAERLTVVSLLHLVQALAAQGRDEPPALFIVTAGSQAVGPDQPVSVAQAPAWGLGRVIALEHPELRCVTVDLSAAPTSEEVQSLLDELWATRREDRIALRGRHRLAARLRPAIVRPREERRHVPPGGHPYRLDLEKTGILDGFMLRSDTRRAPGPGEVEIQISAVGLNFRDVLVALGLVPPVAEGSRRFGLECAGTVIARGEGVEGLAVGEAVVATAPGCFGAFVTVPASLVVRKPAHLSFEEAATIPIAFLTSYYALCHLGRLRRGERVLIHAAAGGVGQAAVQLARHVGAEIFATAGTAEKRAFLLEQGVHHVMDSRSLDFAAEVRRITGGRGVDVVLNSLAGDFIPKSLSTLAPGGRFLEIGKVDVLQNSQLGLRQLGDNIALFVIDLGRLLQTRPVEAGEIFCTVMDLFRDRALEPLRHSVVPISRAADAFRHMAQARHIGKVVVSLEEDTVEVVSGGEPTGFDSQGTYLITGGLGGLGLEVARFLVAGGARHLVLVGRRGPADAAAAALGEMKAAGARIVVTAADVADPAQLARVLEDIGRSMPPLRGVVHAAGIIDDGILLQQDAARFGSVLAPKVRGAWNLHLLTRAATLDFFVLFSSAVSLLGSPGQGSYVAANAFLDALAHYRRARGLPGLAINWGAWMDVGMAARPDRARHLARLGVRAFTPREGLRYLDGLLRHDGAQMMAVSLDRARLPGSVSSLFAGLGGNGGPVRSADAAPERRPRDEILAAAPEERPGLVERMLRERIASVLRCSPTQIDVHAPLSRLGIDSLMAVELKNRLETEAGFSLPVVALLEGPSLAQLTARLLSQVGQASSTSTTPPLVRRETPARLLERVHELSDDQVEALLREAENGAADGRANEGGRGMAR